MPSPTLDTRPWNIVAGLALAATGCGPQLISLDESGDGPTGDSSDSSATLTTVSTTPTTADTDDPECDNDSDCPSYYYCYDGVCEYQPHHDGHLDHDDEYWYPDCFEDAECGLLELCEFEYCEQVDSPPSCGVEPVAELDVLDIPSGAPIATTFADVDGDGTNELVVLSPGALHVYDNGIDPPITTPADVPGAAVLTGGHFDAMPGEDIVVGTRNSLAMFSADGLGGFAAPELSPNPMPGLVGIETADLDGMSANALLLWTNAGAVSNTDWQLIVDDWVYAASVREFGSITPGAALLTANHIHFFSDALTHSSSSAVAGVPPTAITSAQDLEWSWDISATTKHNTTSWSMLEQWLPASGESTRRWGIGGQVTDLASADLDGDGIAELAMVVDGGLMLQMDFLLPESCVIQLPIVATASSVIAGDIDGDGDDELAITLQDGTVALYDGEG